MDHGLRSKNSTVILKPMTSSTTLKPGRKPRGGSRADPIKTVQIIRKVEYSSSIQERDVTVSQSGSSADGSGISAEGGESGKKKCILLIVKKNKEDVDAKNNTCSVKKRVSNCGSTPKIPKTAVRTLSAERSLKRRKTSSAPLQSLPELRQLINFHRNKHAELIQENQLYDTNLNIQSLSLPPIKPVSAPPPGTESATSGSSKDSHGIKFHFRQLMSAPAPPPPLTASHQRQFPGIYKLSESDEAPIFFSKRGGMLGLKHFKAPVTVAKTPLGQLLAFSRQETQSKVPEAWPLPSSPPSQNPTHLTPISSRISSNSTTPPTPKVLFPDDGSTKENALAMTSTCGILWTDSSAKENIPRPRNPSSEPHGILWSDDSSCPVAPPKSSIFQIDLPSMLEYHNLTILSDGLHGDDDSLKVRGDDEKSRAKRVLEDYDMLLNAPDPIYDPREDGYSPADPNIDFKSLEIDVRRDPETIWAEAMQTAGTTSQDIFYDEVYEYLRSEVFDPFKQPYLVTTSSFQDVHGSKGSNNDDPIRPQRTSFSYSTSTALRWKCKLCSEKYATKNSLITHLKVHQQPFCSICLTVTSSMKKLRLHALHAHPSNDRQELLSVDGVIVTSKYGRRRAILNAVTLSGRKRYKPRDTLC